MKIKGHEKKNNIKKNVHIKKNYVLHKKKYTLISFDFGWWERSSSECVGEENCH